MILIHLPAREGRGEEEEREGDWKGGSKGRTDGEGLEWEGGGESRPEALIPRLRTGRGGGVAKAGLEC